ncbi:uncharacterized protein SCHCODRAFT_01154396 [Schizophyllum commune H4-8]|nr:uncharacterized protein SCHCODRAFT_01154396 [Schizophyllum commune H4-8]KAI5891433.1 hypothetical protein SCHCODRAFT_01154396 [Schizophyllum commune H4-8]
MASPSTQPPLDDLPWPELGNVTRGATRGNQGQKGVLGPPDEEGRSVLQLRVQPGVLAVKLNKKTSEWYRILDTEVNNALKQTKTYWRKARRRQDYDARADQDHMELHEWLQQLKDKTMSHLEVLMSKGILNGPPYVLPEDVELTFLRKFIERQAAGIPHNPRLRNRTIKADLIVDPRTGASTPSDTMAGGSSYGDRNALPNTLHDPALRSSMSPALMQSLDPLGDELNTSKQLLQAARATLTTAQQETQEAYSRYMNCLEAERCARQAVHQAERRRDDIMGAMIARRNSASTLPESSSRHSSFSEEGEDGKLNNMSRYQEAADLHHLSEVAMRVPPVPIRQGPGSGMGWGVGGVGGGNAPYVDPNVQMDVRKRSWDPSTEQLESDMQYACDITGMPPRKRMQTDYSDAFPNSMQSMPR